MEIATVDIEFWKAATTGMLLLLITLQLASIPIGRRGWFKTKIVMEVLVVLLNVGIVIGEYLTEQWFFMVLWGLLLIVNTGSVFMSFRLRRLRLDNEMRQRAITEMEEMNRGERADLSPEVLAWADRVRSRETEE